MEENIYLFIEWKKAKLIKELVKNYLPVIEEKELNELSREVLMQLYIGLVARKKCARAEDERHIKRMAELDSIT